MFKKVPGINSPVPAGVSPTNLYLWTSLNFYLRDKFRLLQGI